MINITPSSTASSQEGYLKSNLPSSLSFQDFECRETTPDERRGLFSSFKSSAFRLELLDSYSVDGESDEFSGYLRGDESLNTHNQDWVDFVSECVQAGKKIERVHIIPRELTTYLKFEIEWGYDYSVKAGESVRFIFRDSAPEAWCRPRTVDFWLFDDTRCLLQRYDAQGKWITADLMVNSAEIQFVAHLKQELLGASFDLSELPRDLLFK